MEITIDINQKINPAINKYIKIDAIYLIYI